MEPKELIKQFILQNVTIGASHRTLNDADSFLEKGIIDSTGILELVSFVEETFHVEVRDEELVPENFDSVGALAQYIQRKAKK